MAKDIVGKQEVTFSFEEGTTYGDIVQQLGNLYPGLVGILIAEDGESFLSSNMFVIDGDLANPAMIMEECPEDGEHIHLMSVITGG